MLSCQNAFFIYHKEKNKKKRKRLPNRKVLPFSGKIFFGKSVNSLI
jgi:hypothetical protein